MYGTNDPLEEDEFMAAMEIIFCEHHNRPAETRNPDLVLPHVYVGNINNAENYKLLKKYGITHVLNCAGYKGRRSYNGSPYQDVDVDYKEFLADDAEGYDITQHFAEAFKYLDKVKRKDGCALVHCAQGINRSVAICMAYTMVDKNMNLLKAARHMQRKRGCVLSNRSFQRQLYHFAKQSGYLDSRKELEKALPLEYLEHKSTNIPVKDGYVKRNGYTHCSSFEDRPLGVSRNGYGKAIDKHLKQLHIEDEECNVKTSPTGSSIFEDYLKRMKNQ